MEYWSRARDGRSRQQDVCSCVWARSCSSGFRKSPELPDLPSAAFCLSEQDVMERKLVVDLFCHTVGLRILISEPKIDVHVCKQQD